jgi:hypothetical protein
VFISQTDCTRFAHAREHLHQGGREEYDMYHGITLHDRVMARFGAFARQLPLLDLDVLVL